MNYARATFTFSWGEKEKAIEPNPDLVEVNRNCAINFNEGKYLRVMSCSAIKFRGTSNFKKY